MIQKQYAQGLLDKIQEMKDMLLKEGVHESAFADVGQLDRGVITALEINGSVDSLAGALFGVIDDDNSGFIDEKELQECNDKTNDNWVDAAHSDILATLRGYRKTQRDLTQSKPHTARISSQLVPNFHEHRRQNSGRTARLLLRGRRAKETA